MSIVLFHTLSTKEQQFLVTRLSQFGNAWIRKYITLKWREFSGFLALPRIESTRLSSRRYAPASPCHLIQFSELCDFCEKHNRSLVYSGQNWLKIAISDTGGFHSWLVGVYFWAHPWNMLMRKKLHIPDHTSHKRSCNHPSWIHTSLDN